MECKEIERSIIKKYRKDIWAKFIKAIKEFELIKEGDIIGVCISGGKDSMLMAKCFQELKRHGKIDFTCHFIVMNPGYSDKNIERIKENAKHLEIPIEIFDSPIFDYVNTLKESPCYICARMRRGYLYSKAKELGCNKIALGHHYDDVLETILLNIFYGGEVKTMLPKLHSKNFEGMELIRPLYFVKEASIHSWKRHCELEFLNCACKFTEENYIDVESNSKRLEMKKLVEQLRKTSPYIEDSLFKSVGNVNLDAIMGYRKGEDKYYFLDDYDTKN